MAGPLGHVTGWGRGRSKLVNVMIFGVAPVCLVAIIVAAFALSGSGKPVTASQTSFHAGATASAAAQDATTPTAGPSASAATGQASKNPGKDSSMPDGKASAKTSTSSNPASMPKPTSAAKKPAPSPSHPSPTSTKVVPTDLGPPNFDGYCQSIGQGTATTTVNTAYGWHCSANPALILDVEGACAFSYGLNTSQVINVTTDYASSGSWECWRTNGILGELDIADYCTEAGLGAATLTAQDAGGWSCADEATINTVAACQFMYHNSNAFSRFAAWADPYSWQCWD
jgi:hypothetical protein